MHTIHIILTCSLCPLRIVAETVSFLQCMHNPIRCWKNNVFASSFGKIASSGYVIVCGKIKQPQSHAMQAQQQHCYMTDRSQYDRRCEIGANCSKRVSEQGSDSGLVGISVVGSIISTSPLILQQLPSRISNGLL